MIAGRGREPSVRPDAGKGRLSDWATWPTGKAKSEL